MGEKRAKGEKKLSFSRVEEVEVEEVEVEVEEVVEVEVEVEAEAEAEAEEVWSPIKNGAIPVLSGNLIEGVLDDDDDDDEEEEQELPRKKMDDREYAQAVAIAIQFAKDRQKQNVPTKKPADRKTTNIVSNKLRRLSSVASKAKNNLRGKKDSV